MKRKIHLVTFATESFLAQQIALEKSALGSGAVDSCDKWSMEALRREPFFEKNRAILTAPRGAGYWLWKPYVIQRALLTKSADWILYYDAGRRHGHRIRRKLDGLIDWCEQHRTGMLPGVYVPQWGPNSWWTKRDAFVLMNCDHIDYHGTPQVQATFSLWKNDSTSRDFVAEWLRYCEDSRILTDEPNVCGLPNLPGFIEHRHDQSILTLLCKKYSLPVLGAIDRRFEAPKSIDRVLSQLNGTDLRAAFNRQRRKWVGRLRRSPWMGEIINKKFPLDAIRTYRMRHLD
jgi:hypothetical protein